MTEIEPCDPNRRSKISAISTAMTAIIDERIRQIEAEGWTPDHDDEHDKGELAAAAACYAYGEQLDCSCGPIWPFGEDGWKPSWPLDRKRELVKAGALIVAEIERLDRAALRQAGEG